MREEYLANWAPSLASLRGPAEAADASAAEAREGNTGGRKTRNICILEDSEEEEEEDNEHGGDDLDEDYAQLSARRSQELTTYLALARAHKSTDILQWWHVNGPRFPTVERMWRQFHGKPASSAGVERLFSGAGKKHSDEAANMKSETICNDILASMNYNPWVTSG